VLFFNLLMACSPETGDMDGDTDSDSGTDTSLETDSDPETDTGSVPLSCPWEGMIEILPLGDSITQGDAEHFTYRYPLWQMLLERACAFDFVGSMNTNRYDSVPDWPDFQGQPFDPDHEGHWGWTTRELVDGLPDWLPLYSFDVVLLHAGTNDIFLEETLENATANVEQMVDILRQSNPDAVILLAQIIPTGYATENERIVPFNGMREELADELDDEDSPVIVVDMYNALDPEIHLWDGLHPNEEGETIMAEEWLRGLAEWQSPEADE